MGFINTVANVLSAGSNHQTSRHTRQLVTIQRRRARAARRYHFSHDENGQWITTGFRSIRTPIRILIAADRHRSASVADAKWSNGGGRERARKASKGVHGGGRP